MSKPETNSSTRDRLVHTARDLFLAQGYGATGLAQILREAGVNSGSLYHFFRSKEELLIAVLELYKAGLGPMLVDRIFADNPDPIERIFALLDSYRMGLIDSDFQRSCPIGNLALELNELQPEAYLLVQENFEGWRRAVLACLDDAGDRLDAGCDRGRLAGFTLTTMEGAVMLSRAYREIGPFDDAVANLRDYYDRLIADANRESRDPPRPKKILSPQGES